MIGIYEKTKNISLFYFLSCHDLIRGHVSQFSDIL